MRRIAVAACCLPLVLAAAVSAAGPDSSPPQPSVRCGPPSHAATPFTFTTTDHVRLDGAIVGGDRRGVVVVHEAGRKALCGWWPYAVRLAGRGFRVLLFDMRCYGLSACPQRAPEAVANDIQAATRELRRRGCTSVELVGASFGGSAVIVAAAQDARIAAVVDLSGDEDTVALSARRPTTALAAAEHVRQPALIAVALNDPYVSVADAKRIPARLGSRVKRFELLPASAGHGWDMLTSTSGAWTNLERRLTSFLRAHAG